MSLAISAKVIRVLGEKNVRIREIPQLSGVSKEAVAMALSYLTKRGFAAVSKDPSASRGKVARLTKKGREAQDLYHARLREIEKGWGRRFGDSAMSELREAIETIVGRSTAEPSRLFSWAGATSRELESADTQAASPAPFSDGSPSRRLPGRQLISQSFSRQTAFARE